MVAELRLEVGEFRDLTRWRWVLTEAARDVFVADHEVRLDASCWQFEAFADLPRYLRSHVAPDRWAADEERIVGEVGEWIGSQVLGAVVRALFRRRPAVVRVVVPPEAEALLLRPLELAHAAGRPLSVQDVTLVMDPGGGTHQPAPVGERLRVLGLFSLPDGSRSLNLRRERHSLVRLIEGIVETGKAADVRVLQYGVTRDALAGALSEGDGWDIVHISGHGRPGLLLLETASGQPDLVDGATLAGLLHLARGRVKLVTMSACWSASMAGRKQRRLLGLPVADDDGSWADADAGTAPEALATGLARRLGCAVLAMRYPVGDEFAIALTGKLYDLLIAQGQPLPRALGMTLRELSSAPGSSALAFPALSMATPALFGGPAVDQRLRAPDRTDPANGDTSLLRLAGFPEQASRFVGRTGVMARSSSALAVRSGVPGVLLHGMPGGGKTSCATELAYGHEQAFDQLVYYKAPDDGMTIDGALMDFALTLERYLDGFRMAHELVSPDRLATFLPRLTELMGHHRVLIVVDNAESLLDESGEWRDDRWGLVIGALCGHTGLGRLVLTSRRVPADPAGLRVSSVDALSADETLLLIRELPHLQALSQGKVPGLDRLASRQLARRAIEIARGHPTLLELAEGQAMHSEGLAALVEAGDQAWRRQGRLPDGFFTDGGKAVSGADFLDVLAAWTREVAGNLSLGERDLFWLLCCLEEADRERPVLEDVWTGVWDRLSRGGQPPTMSQAMVTITACGLSSLQAGPTGSADVYAVHPWIAASGRDQAGDSFQAVVDSTTAAYWSTTFLNASSADNGSVHTRRAARAGLAAVPYLTRQQHWGRATALLNNAFSRDPSRANAIAVLPAIQQITHHHPRAAGTFAAVVQVIDPATGEAYAQDALRAALVEGDHRAAMAITARLAALCLHTGRLAEALALADQQAEYTRQAGLGPWTQLADQARRLQVLIRMGHASQVLAEVSRLRAAMDTLPGAPGHDEAIDPWAAREMLLDAGRSAASRLSRWDDALDLNAAIVASMRNRAAPPPAIARAHQHDYFPMLRLGRATEAVALLQDCLATFRDTHDTTAIGTALGALADAEDQRGHGDVAIRLVRDALRYNYMAGDKMSIAVSYYYLGNYRRRYALRPLPALASHLASALIRVLAGIDVDDDGSADSPVRQAAADLRELAGEAGPPAHVADLCDQVGHVPGTDLPGLIANLAPGQEAAEQILRDLIARVQAFAVAPAEDRDA